MGATFHFMPDLPQFLRPRWRGPQPVSLPITRAASIKDVIEAFGVPHTEIGRILCNGAPVDFSHRVLEHQTFVLKPVPVPWDPYQADTLRPGFSGPLRFLVDVNVGRLARYLRMAGFDTLYDPNWTGKDLLRLLDREPRILLTRNLDLLNHKQVVYGRCIRADDPASQLREVMTLLALSPMQNQFGRCLRCNELLQPVAKEEILPRLEPLTKRYFDTFTICPSCDKIYWHGSHADRMKSLLKKSTPDEQRP